MFKDFYFNDNENNSFLDFLYRNDNYNDNDNDDENGIFFNENTSLESDKSNYHYLLNNENSDSLQEKIFLGKKTKKSGELGKHTKHSGDNNIRKGSKKKNNEETGKHNKYSEDNKIKKGKQMKNSEETGKHSKYFEDNKIRKVKNLFRDDLTEFINDKIKTLHLNISDIDFEGKECRGTQTELLTIRPIQTYNTSVKYNLDLFNKTLKDFFSDQINSNYRIYPLEFNALLIKHIYKVDIEKIVTPILDKTFLECLKHYRKDNSNNNCLKGLEKKFEKLKDKLMDEGEEEEYVDDLIRLIKELDDIFAKKNPRKSHKKSK